METQKSENNSADSKRNVEDSKTGSGQAVNANKASITVNLAAKPRELTIFRTLKIIHHYVQRIDDSTKKLWNQFEDFSNRENRMNDDYKSHFDAMYAKVLQQTENAVLHDDNVNNPIPSTSNHNDTSVENRPKDDSSGNKIDECEYLAQLGPGDLVLILDSTFLGETVAEVSVETTEGDKADPSCTVDERKDGQNKSLDTGTNVASREQETVQNPTTGGKIRILDCGDFKAKPLQPVTEVEGNPLRISIDVRNFDIENITCEVVGDKLEVHARVSRQNDFGSETHEIHQVFQVPALADKRKFTARLMNGMLHLEAPMKKVEYEIIK